jgi:hypothetical protein
VATVEAIEAIRPIILGPQSKSRDNSISRLFSRVLQARNTTISKRKERGGDKVNPWNERGVDRLLVQRGSNPGGEQQTFTRWRRNLRTSSGSVITERICIGELYRQQVSGSTGARSSRKSGQ